MRTISRKWLAVLSMTTFVTVAGLAPVIADSPQNPPAEAQKTQTAKGQLTAVDTDAKTLTVKTGEGEQRFQYTDSTKITGAQGGAAGLASASGREVTVTFSMSGADRVAESIEVAADAK